MKKLSRHELLYWLEHRHVPQVFFDLRDTFIRAIMREDDSFYNALCGILADMKINMEFAAEEFVVDCVKVREGYYAVIIKWPEPLEATECTFSICKFDEGFGDLRYLTVECDPVVGSDTVFICEWDKKGRHLNHGTCPLSEALERCIRGV